MTYNKVGEFEVIERDLIHPLGDGTVDGRVLVSVSNSELELYVNGALVVTIKAKRGGGVQFVADAREAKEKELLKTKDIPKRLFGFGPK